MADWMDSLPAMDVASLPAMFAAEPNEPEVSRSGYHIRRAGLGTFAAESIREIHVNPRFADYQRWKGEIDDKTTADMAMAVVGLIREWCSALPPDWLVSTPPAGASRPGPYAAGFLGRAIAGELDLDYQTLLWRDAADLKPCHGKLFALRQLPFHVEPVPATPVIVVDDFINSGSTMKLTLTALRAAGVTCWGFSWGAD